ncbi:MAG: cytochrome P460 [Methyloprofundus sp.]|nr:cytochrome P460 [Methyloprofundus sp.]
MSLCLCLPLLSQAQNVEKSANDIEYPKNLTNWRVIGTSNRTDNNTQRVILGNALAIKAARSQNANINWPKGAILAKLVWKNDTLKTWQAATVPGEFVHAEIMLRDSQKYASTSGWGYARWTGLDLKPHSQDSKAAEACNSCHQAAKITDYVFTIPAKLP